MFNFVRRNSGKLPAISQRILVANFSRNFFGLVFPGFQAPPKIQNSRPKSSAFFFNFTFSNPKCFHGDFLLTDETKREALDVASDDPPDEALSCRRRAWDAPYSCLQWESASKHLNRLQAKKLKWNHKKLQSQVKNSLTVYDQDFDSSS